jgi:1,4-dihydroxy-2-naphthoyl-CoA hydrolase
LEHIEFPDPESLRAMSQNTLGEALGIVVTKVEDGYVEGTMPVDHRTHQPYGLLHGGASVALAETLGSVGSHFIAAQNKMLAVGVEINANHLRGKREGTVTGKARLIHRGGKLHVWNIDIVDERGKLVCTSRLTTMLVPDQKA